MKNKHITTTIQINGGEDVISVSEFGSMVKRGGVSTLEGFKMQTGDHINCGSMLTLKNAQQYKVLHCHGCGLRIKFPVEIIDGKTLKKYLENQ